MISVPTIDLVYYYKVIVSFFVGQYPEFVIFLKSFVGLVVGLSIPVSICLLIGIIYVVEGIKSIRAKEDIKYSAAAQKVEPAFTDLDAGKESDTDMGNRWKNVMLHMDSENPNDWRQAIIEADIMLDDLLEKLGYRGESIGEKLKRVATGDFKSLAEAKEAHWVRNRIAHDGSNFDLNKVEAGRIIALYRKVFDEFYDISQ